MSEKETKILDTFGKAIPKLSELEKEKLLAFGEGMAFMVERKDSTAQAPGHRNRKITPPPHDGAGLMGGKRP